jgi:hypothetical protein
MEEATSLARPARIQPIHPWPIQLQTYTYTTLSSLLFFSYLLIDFTTELHDTHDTIYDKNFHGKKERKENGSSKSEDM